MKWTKELCLKVVSILKKHTSLEQAQGEIWKALREPVTSHALRHAFDSHRIGAVRSFLKPKPTVPPPPPSPPAEKLWSEKNYERSKEILSASYSIAEALPAICKTLNKGVNGGALEQAFWRRYNRTAKSFLKRSLVTMNAQPVRPGEEQLPPVVEHRLKAKVAQLEFRVKSLLDDLSNAQRMNDLVREVSEINIQPILPRERSSGLREGTALALASDWHLEEEVLPEKVSYRNRYNLEIAEQRATRFFEAILKQIIFSRQIYKIRDLVLWFGGDFITNYLHEDNRESNLLSPPRAIAYALSVLSTGIRFLLNDKQLERIVIPCNDGNHSRLTKFMHSTTRVDNSLEWLLYTMLSREFKDEKRVEFIIATGEQIYYDIYGRVTRFLHGDSVRYAGGVGGITIPIYKALAMWDKTQQAELTCMGHWHQYLPSNYFIVNGSLIGHSPYAVTIKAAFEPPQQSFTVLDSVRWRSLQTPLWVSERSDDQRSKTVIRSEK